MTDHRRRTLMSGLGAFGLVAAGLLPVRAAAQTLARSESGATMPRLTREHRVINLHRVDTQRDEVALTFDDGPHPQHTPALLDVLARYRVRATFYVIGTMVRRYPEIAQRIVAEGHELGNHTWSHPTLSRQGDWQVLAEIDRTQELIWNTVGHVPVTFRPPYGAITPRQSRMLHADRNLPTVVWSVDPQDWRRPGPSVVARRMVEGARAGAIILAHDIHAGTVAAVPEAIEGLQARGFDCVTMSEMLGWGRWGPALPRNRFVGRPVPDPFG